MNDRGDDARQCPACGLELASKVAFHKHRCQGPLLRTAAPKGCGHVQEDGERIEFAEATCGDCTEKLRQGIVQLARQRQRIDTALDYALRYGGIDGAHHKMWVIDQMVRALTACPLVLAVAKDSNQEAYEYERQGASEEYQWLIQEHQDGADGPNTYGWDEGTPP